MTSKAFHDLGVAAFYYPPEEDGHSGQLQVIDDDGGEIWLTTEQAAALREVINRALKFADEKEGTIDVNN
ncbi:hypothetical protein CHUUTOTORO_02410 [Serratia phage vB_SmaM-ChuuTotoro]|nr:hypothetical protein CHUUTOTORO_02410 [Serratia phage vB_SmaM-ChuuTotoro]